MFRFHITYIDGPLDGHSEERQRAGLEPDINCQDPQTGSWHHYAICALPEINEEPVPVEYRHVAEYDPTSGYLEEVAARRALELSRRRPSRQSQ